MAPDRSTAPAEGDVLLMVGTMKGAFLFWADGERREWRMEGPHFRGETVYSLAFDQRGGRRRMLAGTQSFHWGSVVRASDDFGVTWSSPERQNVRFPEDSGLALANIWQLRPGRDGEPGVVYAGVEPAALFESRDAGESWSPVDGLLRHEHRPKWMPGGGGLCLHTIVLDPADPRRMGIAISTAGFYRTDDGGRSWHPRNQGVRAQFLPDKYPEFGQCVHKVVNHPARPERLYLQNHWGLYRSDDWGDSWTDIANGVPSDFGFAMEVHPHEPDTVYIVPLESDEFRCVPEARLRVYRTRDGGDSWHALENGLPQQGAFETVLRDAMVADTRDPAGIYFGTRLGKLYGSADAGDSWREISDALPPIVCVKAAVIGAAGAGS
ncbi:MAG TPA: hypothetical protein VGB15_14840 [Longimicrobium sp.]|jgi:photosystem II stability/assembly factor-like uncharacterized protein